VQKENQACKSHGKGQGAKKAQKEPAAPTEFAGSASLRDLSGAQPINPDWNMLIQAQAQLL